MILELSLYSRNNYSILYAVCTVSLFGSASFSMAMTKYGKMAGSASAVLGFASMFSAGIVSPLVGIGGGIYGYSHGGYTLVCAALSLLCLYGLVEERIIYLFA